MSERRFGILIASSRFPDEPKLEDLRFPENDVDGFNEILTSKDHGQFTETFVLKNKLHHEILLKINQILRDADRNDLVLIYYSGHGKLNPAGKLHLTSTDTLISALEATSIPVSTIKDYVDISSSNKIILILDCCFSGAAGEAFARSGVDDQLQLVSGGRGTYIMTASTGIQVAQERESDQYGAFTKHVIEGIKSGEADLNSDGRITMGELYRYVHDHVLEEGFQDPMKWDLNVRGELVIARSSRTPREERRKQIREILFELAKKDLLPDDILDKARQVIALEPDQFSEEDRTYDRLIDQLLKKRLEPVEFIRKWDKVRAGKPDLQTKSQEELKRKAEEEKHRKEQDEAKSKQKEAEAKLKADEEERKRKEAEEREKKAELERRAREEKEDRKRPPTSSKSRKTTRAFKLGVLAGVAVLLVVGIWWYIVKEAKPGTLFVRAMPENATVKILNIDQGFRQGMDLEPGKYHIQVSSEGYEPQDRWIDFVAGHREPFRFELAKIEVAEPISPQKAITNSIGMKFVLVSAGSFTMGSQLSPEEVARKYGGKAEMYKYEQPQHPVKITKPFYLQTTEVSQEQWEKVMGANPSKFKDCGNDCPVEQVSWDMAQEFISKLNQMESTNKYRIPTEAEWEYACRAKTKTAYSFGDEVDKLGEYAWYSDNSGEKTKPAGKKLPNAWGLYDMHGNVWEWCQDWYGDYPSNSVADPKGPDKGKYRVLRGGSWYLNVWYLRSAKRGGSVPGNRRSIFGFRVALDF